MIRLTYGDDEYMFNDNAWSFANSEDSVSDTVASKLSVIAVESGVDPVTFSSEPTASPSPSPTKVSMVKAGRKSKNPKIKIFDN